MTTCRTCRHWDAHSIDLKKGDCRAPGDHRYWHLRMSDGSVAYMDSFEGAATKPHESCHAWRGENPMTTPPLPPTKEPHDPRPHPMTTPSPIRSVAVFVDCSACDGTGKVYAFESSSHQSPCETCTGTGEVIAGLSLADFRALIKESP